MYPTTGLTGHHAAVPIRLLIEIDPVHGHVPRGWRSKRCTRAPGRVLAVVAIHRLAGIRGLHNLRAILT